MYRNPKADESLWNGIREGNRKSLDELFYKYIDYLYAYGTTLCDNRELIKDTIQDVFLDLWERRKRLPAINNTSHYLLVAFKRTLLRRNKELYTTIPESSISVPSFEAEWIVEEEIASRNQSLKQIITALPGRQKEIIFLRFYQNMNYEEISRTMGITQQVARNMVHRTIRKLRKNCTFSKKFLL